MPSVLPELLAPAGTPEQLESALLYGADAVYLGGGELSLRAARGFQGHALENALARCRQQGVRLYYCLNAFPRQRDMPQVEAALEYLGGLTPHPDALIIADAGVLQAARRICPHIPVHLSTQANTGNAASAAFWAGQGVSRVNLARELPLAQIREIRRQLASTCPELEVECFVHGALCLALSGQCLLSAWLQDRPANEGRCTQPCRYKYRPLGAPSLAVPPVSQASAVRVEEALRPGEALWEVTQHWEAPEQGDDVGEHHNSVGEQGDYAAIWSPDDICLIRFLPWFARMGVDSLKIEGRMRTGAYVAHAVDTYRAALNAMGQRQNAACALAYPHGILMEELRQTATRALGTGFFIPRRQCIKTSALQAGVAPALAAAQPARPLPLLARVEEQLTESSWRLSVRGRWQNSEPVSLIVPGLRRPVLAAGSYGLENTRGQMVGEVHSGTSAVLHCAALPNILGQAVALQPGIYIRACSA